MRLQWPSMSAGAAARLGGLIGYYWHPHADVPLCLRDGKSPVLGFRVYNINPMVFNLNHPAQALGRAGAERQGGHGGQAPAGAAGVAGGRGPNLGSLSNLTLDYQAQAMGRAGAELQGRHGGEAAAGDAGVAGGRGPAALVDARSLAQGACCAAATYLTIDVQAGAVFAPPRP